MKLKVNRRLLPLKLHFFIFWASISSALPFMMVVARQLGIPVGIQGTISAAIITATVLAKPVIAAAADFLPSFRKGIFLALLTIMVMTASPIGFLPPMYPSPEFAGRLLLGGDDNASSVGNFYLLTHGKNSDSCLVTVGWDCKASCKQHEICPLGNTSLDYMKMTHLRTQSLDSFPGATDLRISNILPNVTRLNGSDDLGELYKLEGFFSSLSDDTFNISVSCKGGERTGVGCVSLWNTLEFWIYVILLLAGQLSAMTVESISDAICLDTIGENGDYGSQRAWGALSYGILGTVSGLLVDWHSGSSFMKDYTPAFLLMAVFGTIDVLLSVAYLKVPKFEGVNVTWSSLRPLLFQPQFFVFLVFVFLVGFYDGVDTGYVFILQEDMAAGTSTMNHMKLLQGLTMLVQALTAAPFMFVFDWFKKTMGSQKVISLVFALYTIRLLGLALAGYVKLVWATIAIEVINGPCFGLGYTAIIDHASSITPPGTSATVQSVVSICYGTLGYAGASLIGGLLYEAVGGLWLYGITGILAAVTCILHVLSLKFLSPIPGKDTESQKEKDVTIELNQNSLKVKVGPEDNQKKTELESREEDPGTEEERESLLQRSRVNGGNMELQSKQQKEVKSGEEDGSREIENNDKGTSVKNSEMGDSKQDTSASVV